MAFARRRAWVAVLAAAVVVGGCGGGHEVARVPPPPWRRPLHLPRLAAPGRCPLAPAHGRTFLGPAAGPGPVYLAGFDGRSALPMFTQPRSRWAGQQVVVLATARYQGPILIRGGQVGGPGAVGFGGERVPENELQLRAPGVSTTDEPPGWRAWLALIRVRTRGCYAVQVDGTSFSYAIVFEAQLRRAGPAPRRPSARAREADAN